MVYTPLQFLVCSLLPTMEPSIEWNGIYLWPLGIFLVLSFGKRSVDAGQGRLISLQLLELRLSLLPLSCNDEENTHL